VRIISIAKNPLTILSETESGFCGFLRNPNSNGDTQAVYTTSVTRKVSHPLQNPKKIN
jgi:hypothetical protein